MHCVTTYVFEDFISVSRLGIKYPPKTVHSNSACFAEVWVYQAFIYPTRTLFNQNIIGNNDLEKCCEHISLRVAGD